ncbi:MAG: hypothetical protein J7L82_06960 [Staphylothermus sp.]|nr:hypothetical protein [Staphylothermus sp.]
MKYKLPLPDNLKRIGCPSEFATLKLAKESLRDFADRSTMLILRTLFPLVDYSIPGANISSNHDSPELVVQYFEDIFEGLGHKIIDKYMSRKVLSRYTYKKLDFNINIWPKKYAYYVIDSQFAAHSQARLGIDKEEALKEIAYNLILRNVILLIDKYLVIEWGVEAPKIKRVKYEIEILNNPSDFPDEPLAKARSVRSQHNEVEARKDELEVLMSVWKKIVTVRAYFDLHSIHLTQFLYPPHNYHKISPSSVISGRNRTTAFAKALSATSIKDKENIILQVMRLQGKAVRKSKKSNGSGKNKKKRERFQKYFQDHPHASNKEIVDAIKLDVKTVKKYREETVKASQTQV